MAYTTIDDPTIYFNTVTWTGDGSSSRNITGVGFQPDWVWGKCRNTTVSHALYDSVRGGSKLINSNTTSAEGTNAALSAFVSDGFSVNSDSYFNGNSNTYVAWNWKAGTSFSNDASATGVGTIDSTGSVNTTAGFSIISYTGTGSAGTIAHGLGAVPAWIITKTRSTAQPWRVYHKALGETFGMILNDSSVKDDDNTAWNDTAPTSSVFSVGTSANTNGSGSTFIAYCFAEKKGYSKFGSFTGNSNADGTFVFCGFRPAWILVRNVEISEGFWVINDNKRNTFNPNSNTLVAQNNNSEDAGTDRTDFLSNGFKLRTTSGSWNGSGNKIIYMAFAESPLVNSNGVPNNAR